MLVTSGKYRNWDIRELENEWIKLFVAPQLGGRIIQLKMDNYEYLFVNPSLAGMEPDASRLGQNGTWLNFGGEKIWPAPQGWNSSEQWPGPPDPVLDSGIYSFHENDLKNNGITLLSSFDSYTGIQIERRISLQKNTSEVIINAAFHNRSNISRKWSVWPVCQMNISANDYDNRYQVVCPVNKNSRFEKGYSVMHGLVNNPQLRFNKYGNLAVDYQYLVGKTGIDTYSNWVIFNDKKTGKTCVFKVQPEKDKIYPDNTTVQIWTQGRGIIYSRNKITEFKDDKHLNPPYLEIELLSPLKQINPGKRIQYEYRILAATIPLDEDVQDVNNYGIIVSNLHADYEGEKIRISGKYGVFTNGKLKIMNGDVFIKGKENVSSLYELEVTPHEGIHIDFYTDRKKLFCEEEGCMSAVLFDEQNQIIGEIDKIILNNKT